MAKVEAECGSSFTEGSFVPSTMSKTSSGVLITEFKVRKKDMDRAKFTEYLCRTEIPFGLAKFMYQLYDRITTFGHQYISEVCMSWCHDMHFSTEWSANVIIDDDRFIRDWRGRVLTVNELTPKAIEGNVHPSGSPLLSAYRDIDDEDVDGSSEILHVDSLIYPIFPMGETRKGSFFTSGPEGMKYFLGQRAITLMRQDMKKLPSLDLEKKMFTDATESMESFNRFKAVCTQTFSTRKKCMKDAFFSELGYNYIRSNKPKGTIHDKKLEEMKMAYSKIYRLLQSGERDISWWRTAKVDEICNGTANRSSTLTESAESDGTVDGLFQNEPARKAFQQFSKYFTKPTYDATVLSLIRLDALVTGIVDVLNVEDIEDSDDNNEEKRGLDNVRKRTSLRGGRVPPVAVRTYKGLLTLAASQFLCNALPLFKDGMKKMKRERLLREEMSVGRDFTGEIKKC